jgi:hypothetical protein
MPDNAAINKLVESIDPSFAQAMKANPSKVTPLPSTFFAHGRLYHIAVNGPYGPQLMTLGVVDPDIAISLGSNPKGFFQLAGRAGLLMDTQHRRDSYVGTFLDTTKDLAKRTQFLNSLPPLRKNMQPTQKELVRYQELKAKYGPLIKPLSLTTTQPWKGEAYALVIWDLVKYEVTLQPDGKVAVNTTVLEKNMPTCIDFISDAKTALATANN